MNNNMKTIKLFFLLLSFVAGLASLSSCKDDEPDNPDTHEWVDLGLPSGTLWATCNIGANAPEDYGDYFAGGETKPKDNYDLNNYKWYNHDDNYYTKYNQSYSKGYYDDSGNYVPVVTKDGKTELDPEDDAAYVNWGPSWRMPTHEQQQELVEQCTWTWTTRNGVSGMQGTGPNGKTIFFPAAGWRREESLDLADVYCCCWSRTLYPLVSEYAYNLNFFLGDNFLGGYCLNYNYARDIGFSVRAVRVPQN